MNEWYRYAAIRKLISIDSDTYLPIYIKNLISGGFILSGYGFTMIDELYDFPNSVEIVLKSNTRLEGNNFEYLARKVCECFEKYPQEVRKKILNNRDYFVRRDCDQTMWKMMSVEEKLYLSTEIIANEYAKLHDAITFENFLIDQDRFKVVFLTDEFHNQVDAVINHKYSRLNELQDNPKFDCPKYDAATHQYTPSEQFIRFLSLAQTEDSEMPYHLLNKTFHDLRNSRLIRSRRE